MKRLIPVVLIFLFTAALPGVIAQRPDAPAYGRPGPYAVGTRDYHIEDPERPLDVSVWYPAGSPEANVEPATYVWGALFREQGEAVRDVPMDTSGAPYPLVIFSHGSGGFRFQSLFFTEHLASHGFVVIALDHPTNTLLDNLNSDAFSDNLALNFAYRPLDVLRVIDYAETLTADDGDLAGMIDTDRVALTGHSFGGYTALAAGGAQLNFDQLRRRCESDLDDPDQLYGVCFLLEDEDRIAEARALETPPEGAWPPISDPHVRAVVAFAPWNGPILDADSLSKSEIPAMILVGTADSITPPSRDARQIFETMFRNTKALVELENGGHHIFVDECSELAIRLGLFERCSDSVWDMERAHDLTNHLTTAFLRSVLYEDESASTALQAEQVNFTGVRYELVTTIVDELVPEILSTWPHDTQAYTQGLLLHNNLLYESTGQYGESDLREVDPETGEILRIVNIRDEYFAEGLALVGDKLIQLTWRSGLAVQWDLDTFVPENTFPYNGEGWGLCYDAEHLYMSNGSDTITVRDPQTFQALDQFQVTMRGEPVSQLNELECVGPDIYANVWQTDYIMRIDKATGKVTARIDAAGLLTGEELAELNSGAVLNGIAYNADTETFLITGKYWPKLFEVRFVPR